MIEIGKINRLKVVRQSDLGYMLSDGEKEILMHYKQAAKVLEKDEMVDVYIYTDKENRPTATMHPTVLQMGKPAFATVVQVLPGIGVFVDNQTPKDLLVSKDYLPYDEQRWPQVGDRLFLELKMKKNALMAKPVNRFDVKSLAPDLIYTAGQRCRAFVLRLAEKGAGLITDDRIYVFVPLHQYRKPLRLGEEVMVTITKMLDHEAYGTLNEHKEILMDDDKKLLLEYLKSHAFLKLTAKSTKEEVESYFPLLSRKAFKRAYGNLYKEGLIWLDEEKTYLKQ